MPDLRPQIVAADARQFRGKLAPPSGRGWRTTAIVASLAVALGLACCAVTAPTAGRSAEPPTLVRPLQRSVVEQRDAVRRQHGLLPVRVSAGLAAAAREHSRERASLGYSGESHASSQPEAHVIAQVRAGGLVALHTRPFGPVVARVGALTRFGSRRSLGVVATRRGRWLAVTEPGVGRNRVVWVDAHAGGLRYSRTPLELDVDLSQRTLTVRRGDTLLRRTSVGVGASDSPTPTGRFAVTDKLAGAAYSPAYGCCILALSATQTNLSPGWSGGDRIAIHGTLSASDFGRAVSGGCVHAREGDLRWLMRVVPLGTPVVIRP
jgi:hypothetical protein